MSIPKTKQQYPVITLYRDDIGEAGYDTNTLTDDDMNAIASDIADMIQEHCYMPTVRAVCADRGLAKLPD